MNLKKIYDDLRSEMRYNDLRDKGLGYKHYLNQIAKSKGDKKYERAQTFYLYAKRDGNTELADLIKETYPELFEGFESKERAWNSNQLKKQANDILQPLLKEEFHSPEEVYTFGVVNKMVDYYEQNGEFPSVELSNGHTSGWLSGMIHSATATLRDSNGEVINTITLRDQGIGSAPGFGPYD